MTYFCQWMRLLSFSFFIFASSFARIVLKHHSRHPRTVELLWSQFMLQFFLNTLFYLTDFLQPNDLALKSISDSRFKLTSFVLNHNLTTVNNKVTQ